MSQDKTINENDPMSEKLKELKEKHANAIEKDPEIGRNLEKAFGTAEDQQTKEAKMTEEPMDTNEKPVEIPKAHVTNEPSVVTIGEDTEAEDGLPKTIFGLEVADKGNASLQVQMMLYDAVMALLKKVKTFERTLEEQGKEVKELLEKHTSISSGLEKANHERRLADAVELRAERERMEKERTEDVKFTNLNMRRTISRVFVAKMRVFLAKPVKVTKRYVEMTEEEMNTSKVVEDVAEKTMVHEHATDDHFDTASHDDQ